MASPDTYSKDAAGSHQSHVAFNLSVIALVVMLVGIGAAYLLDAAGRQQVHLPDLRTAGPSVEKIIGGHKLGIPPAWFRFEDQRVAGFSDKVDLIFALPLGPDNHMREVMVTLSPRSRARSSARLLDAVYLHKFLPQQLEGPPGLVGKPLREEGGFAKETVWYDPLSANPFVTKCMQPVMADQPASCVRTIVAGNEVAVTYVFDMRLMENWKRFDSEAGKWLAKIDGL